MRPNKLAIFFALALPGLAPHLAWSAQSLRPASQVARPEPAGAGALSLNLETMFRTIGYVNVTLHPEAIDDPIVHARLDRLEAALGEGLRQVQGMAHGYERTDRARALAGCALDLARIVWEAAFDATAAHSMKDAGQLWALASRLNDAGGRLIAAAGSTSSAIHSEDLARLRLLYNENRSHISAPCLLPPPTQRLPAARPIC